MDISRNQKKTRSATPVTERVFQLKIALKGVRPAVWRRIQVPADFTFWDLHVAIQDAMGWLDRHVHCFEFQRRNQQILRIGIPIEEDAWIPSWLMRIADLFKNDGDESTYKYDFGDNWQHRLVLESIPRREDGVNYPRCTAGKRACPPEDSGGPSGYAELLKISKNPLHPKYKETMEWLGQLFEPEAFDPDDVVFTDSRKRLLQLKEDAA